jgi:hypothetical protein
MNTEYAIGNLRIRFESRTRRRWLVAFFYASLAALDLAARTIDTTGPLILIVCGLLWVALLIVISWLVDNAWTRGDEREMQRRDHAYYVAYRSLLWCFVAGFLLYPGVLRPLFASYFWGHFLRVAVCFLIITLPPAILLWTEPDMEDPRQPS